MATIRASAGNREFAVELRPYAPDDGVYREYQRLLCRVYAEFGMGMARKNAGACMLSCSHLVLVRKPDGEVVGGVRVHRRDWGTLPTEMALSANKRLPHVLDGLDRCTELSGAAVDMAARKSGLSLMLMRAAVASLPLVPAGSAIGFGHQYALALYRRIGLVPAPSLGRHQYPDKRYDARVVVLRDAHQMSSVTTDEREAIEQLRARLHLACEGANRLQSTRIS